MTSRLIVGRTNFLDFDLLAAMIASALKKFLHTHSHFRKRVSVEEQRAQKSDRGFVRSRNCSKQWTAELITIEDSCKTSYSSDDFYSKLQGSERCCGKRISHQESKRKESLRNVGACFQWKAHGQCSKGDSCSFRTQWPLATVALARDEKDDRLLPHPTRRQSRLTVRKRRQDGKF